MAGAARRQGDRLPSVESHRRERLITAPGHDEESRTYLRPAEGLNGVQGNPVKTTEDVEQARDLLLDEYLGDFGFEDDGSRAHALGLAAPLRP